jgi:hypothetical protein
MWWQRERPVEADDTATLSATLNERPRPVPMPPVPRDELREWLEKCARRNIRDAEDT